MLIDPVLAGTAQSSAAIVVLLDALAKWRRPAAFRGALAQYQLLPEAFVTPAALAVTGTETLGAAALLLPDSRILGAAVLTVLLVSFAVALTINILRGHTDIDCGCSGFASLASMPRDAAARGIGWLHVVRALLIAVFVATTFIEPATRAIVWFDYITLVFAVLLTVCALLVFDTLLANGPRLNQLRNS
ncbi:methylamine utilization protein MauE [Paraburkholderia agricolaris]|uniref:MauE/DoxX family redox-associated membrane protein n=1 Tax=Paraburkholderia agricolaris TaxID=2152888 RepID=UPI0038BAC289